MKNKLIPIYREKELYTLFYDQDHNGLYKLEHRKKSAGIYILLFLAVLYGSEYANSIYQDYKGSLVNIILFFIILALSYAIAQIMYSNYYVQDKKRSVYFDKDHLEEYANKGTKQLRIELYGCAIGLLMAIFGFVLFFIINQLMLLIVGGLGAVILFILIFMHPFARMKVLKDFRNRKIDL